MISEKPIRLILVRHGNTFESGQTPVQVGKRSDLPLTAQGKNQAHSFANYLLGSDILPVAIYAGTLKRQIETAQIVGKELHIERNIHLNEPALTEIDYGRWEGLTTEEITSKWPEEYARWTTQARWAEGVFEGTFEGHLKAIESWINMLRRTYASGDTVVGVTSNGIIRFFYSLIGKEWQQLIQEGQMENLKVKTGHICELSLFKDSLQVKSWNKDPRDFSTIA